MRIQDFKYPTNNDPTSISSSSRTCLATLIDTPYFAAHRWNSYRSPAVLCDFANLIGGFDDVHDCYGDYKEGTDEWFMTHYKCRVTIGDDVRYYEACPNISTGYVETKMIDFSDTSKMTRLL